MNPGKIVNPPRMDDASLFRYGPSYRAISLKTSLDWSEWGGYDKAVEMCNNNGHCRKFDADTMCPSYRVTRDEVHLTRGRANTLRLALSGQLPFEAAKEALELCVSCKGCKRECPTGVDMARMKIEFLAQHRRSHAPALRERLVAYLRPLGGGGGAGLELSGKSFRDVRLHATAAAARLAPRSLRRPRLAEERRARSSAAGRHLQPLF
jgi:Fe-S oxidoreductase